MGEPVSKKADPTAFFLADIPGPADLVPAFSYLVHHGRWQILREEKLSAGMWRRLVSVSYFQTILLPQFNISPGALTHGICKRDVGKFLWCLEEDISFGSVCSNRSVCTYCSGSLRRTRVERSGQPNRRFTLQAVLAAARLIFENQR